MRIFGVLGLLLLGLFAASSLAFTPLAVKDDPHVRMPGSQPPTEGGVVIEAPNRCMNCHGGYDSAVEPGFNWQGSMMAQAARDPLFFACLTVSAQDAIWAVGNPNATDICLRCHFPKGWVEGRSDPTNGSLMTGGDWDGVHCDVCHRQVDPFFENSYQGYREGNQWVSYWDETGQSQTPSQAAADAARAADADEISDVYLFNGSYFLDEQDQPFSAAYTESGGGQYFLSENTDKRASFADANPRHGFVYSRYHKSKYFCATCHDVSNPILNNLGADPAAPLPTEVNPAHSYYHVERTFSEFMLSDYGQQGGAQGIGPFAPEAFNTSKADNSISMCQDCHMRDGIGVGSDKSGSPLRTGDPQDTESIEHPYSGQPIHDMTGGNVWISRILASSVQGSANYDQVNYDLLMQGPNILTLDLTAGEGLEAASLLAGADRAEQQLQMAAAIENVAFGTDTGNLTFRIQNHSGHKLISGFPEGRRMFVNIQFYSAEPARTLLYEINPYDYTAGTLKGLGYSYTTLESVLPLPAELGSREVHVDQLVYEIKPSSTITGEEKTFHIALATERYKDNRIPPKGFRINEASERLSQPRWGNQDVPGYFTAEEYSGGYDQVSLSDFSIQIPDVESVDSVEIRLYYQTTSREYIEFLRDEINGTATSLTGTGAGGDPPYIIQTHAFFSKLKAWGDTIWQLWLHNMDAPGGAPLQLAEASVNGIIVDCNAPVPTFAGITAETEQVLLQWQDLSGDQTVTGYEVYYDQAGKSQFIASVAAPSTTTYLDAELLGGVPHCYKLRSTTAQCNSVFSGVECSTPYMRGDLDRDMNILLEDAVYGLRVLAAQPPGATIYASADVNEDERIGLAEVIHALKIVAALD